MSYIDDEKVVVTNARANWYRKIARAYISQHGMPAPEEWGLGGNIPIYVPLRHLSCCPSPRGRKGEYVLTAFYDLNGRKMGPIYGPVFQVKKRRYSNENL
jgi:hypothetical protein